MKQSEVESNLHFFLFFVAFLFCLFLLLFPHLFVPLALLKVLSFEKTQIKFGFLLTYSYLCT